MPQAPHPITTIRRQARESATPNILMEGCFALAPRVLPHSRRAARLLERVGLERPSLKLSGLLAELSVAGHKGIPAALVDKLADALGEMLAGRPPRRRQEALAPPLLRLVAALDDLERRTIAGGPTSRSDAIDVGPRPCVARLTLDENPPAFFYAEGRGLDAVPAGLVVALAPLAKNEPLVFVPARGPMLDVPSRLYAIERIRDVVFEPIADEGARLVSMLATGAVVRLALLPGGGLRLTLRDPALAEQIGLLHGGGAVERPTPVGVEEEPGRWLVLHPERAREIVAALALRDDITLAWSSAERFETRRATAQQLKVRLGEKRDWLGLEAGVAIDDDVALTLGELLTALREGRRYVIAQGNTLVALDEALADALAPLTMNVTGPALVHLAQAGARMEGAAWNELRADLERARLVDGVPAASLRAELRPYQRDGLRFLRRLEAWGIGGVLADDMGLGKTVQAIAWLLDRSGDGPALVVAPTSVTFNWHDELVRFAPSLRTVRYEGARRAARLHGLGKDDVVVSSYAIVQRDAALLAQTTWGALILDEAQHVKNAGTRRAKGVRAISAQRRLALTGTPLENHTGELWAVFDAVAPGLFGSWAEFKARFAAPIEKEADVRRRRTLAKAIAPFVLRRKKRDVAPELPPRTEVVRCLPLELGERRAYERVRQALLVDLLRASDDERRLEAPERRVKVLAAITKLRLVACHESYASDVVAPPDHVVPGTKQRALVELLVSLRQTGERALVFSQFVRHLEIARAAATSAGVTSLQLDGSTPAEQRRALVERFQAGEVDAFFLSLKAGGTGLNLVRASYVIHLDPWWNPAVEDQAADRAHRIGQTQPVTVVRLVAEDTIEEQILELHEHKRALIEGVLEGTAAAGTLDTDELLDLVRHTRRSARAEDRAQELADELK